MLHVARAFFSAGLLLVFCLCSCPRARATVFRDRAQFSAAAQNLSTIDFESPPATFPRDHTIDGLFFENNFGPLSVSASASGKILFAGSGGEITTLTIYLPPGTTAVGCEQFSTPMTVSASSGESVTMQKSDGSTFVGFVSAAPIQKLVFSLDFPEPTPDVLLDNLSYGQRGGDPPTLLADADTGRAAALDSVTEVSEPFSVLSPQTLAPDGHGRVTLFLVGVRLAPDDAPLVTAQAEDSQRRVFSLPVEATGLVKNLSWMSQVTARLPDALGGAGDVSISVNVRGVASNKATVRIN